MSPEPTHQQPTEENYEICTNLINERVTDNDSMSEDEYMESFTNNYLPLSQTIVDNNTSDDDCEIDDSIDTIESDEASSINFNQITNQTVRQIEQSEVSSVWMSPCNRSSINLDVDKINQVKSMMAGFTLPKAAIPEWATVLSEDVWKNRLIDRIKEIRKS